MKISSTQLAFAVGGGCLAMCGLFVLCCGGLGAISMLGDHSSVNEEQVTDGEQLTEEQLQSRGSQQVTFVTMAVVGRGDVDKHKAVIWITATWNSKERLLIAQKWSYEQPNLLNVSLIGDTPAWVISRYSEQAKRNGPKGERILWVPNSDAVFDPAKASSEAEGVLGKKQYYTYPTVAMVGHGDADKHEAFVWITVDITERPRFMLPSEWAYAEPTLPHLSSDYFAVTQFSAFVKLQGPGGERLLESPKAETVLRNKPALRKLEGKRKPPPNVPTIEELEGVREFSKTF